MTDEQRKELASIHESLRFAIQRNDPYGIGAAEGRLNCFLAKLGAPEDDEPSVYETRGPLVF